MRQGVTYISFGDRLHSATGYLGRIRAVVLDRNRCQVHALIVRRGIPPVDYVIPTRTVRLEEGREGHLRLHETGEQIPMPLMGGYSIDEVAALLDQHAADPSGTPPWPFGMEDFVLLRSGQLIKGHDGEVGRLKRIIARWPERNLAGVVMRVGRLRCRCVRIPRTALVGWAGEQIYINLTPEAIEALPDYRPDGAIRSAIDQALQRDDAIQRIDKGMVAVEVADGCVTLTGHVTDSRNRDGAEQVVRRVRGVRDVTNEIVTDASLANNIAEALGRLDRATSEQVRFTVTHGTVCLFGSVPDAHVRREIETVVAAVPEARMISNEITVAGQADIPPRQRLMQPRAGQRVFAQDRYIGRVKHVVLDPCLRQATAIIVDSLAEPATRDWLEDAPVRKRMLAIPADVIETLSPVEVFLKIDSAVAATMGDVRPEQYVIPPAEWRAPFPYRREEILLQAAPEASRVPRIAVDLRDSRPARRLSVDAVPYSHNLAVAAASD